MPFRPRPGAALALCLVAACVPGESPDRPDASTASYRLPGDSLIPEGPLGASIRRGRALLAATRDSLPDHVGNDLRCTSCHLDDGTRPHAAPWVGVYSRFPQYRSRNAKVNVIQDRINDCIQRSLNGRPLPEGGRDMADMIAYMAFLSTGVAPPGTVPGEGFRRVDPLVPDTVRGRLVYVAQCARCHGGEGEGMANPDPAGQPAWYPPLWGPRSFSVPGWSNGMLARMNAAAVRSRAIPAPTLNERGPQSGGYQAGCPAGSGFAMPSPSPP
jgi:thiosulfate dehydrogenase